MGMNGIFEAGDGVLLRVSRPTAPPEQAIWLADTLTRCGLRVPVYLHDQPFVIDGHAVFAIAAIAEQGAVDWAGVGEMVARLHLVDADDISVGYPLPFCADFPWWDFASVMNEVGGDLDRRARTALDAAIGRGLPLLEQQRSGRSVVCHGDVHPGNVIQSLDGPVLLDWDLLCRGPSAWDHAPLMTWTERWGGQAGIYDAFAAGYGRTLRNDHLAEAIAELRLVAATLMRMRAARTNRSAVAEAELRLRYWRGEVEAPAWHAQ